MNIKINKHNNQKELSGKMFILIKGDLKMKEFKEIKSYFFLKQKIINFYYANLTVGIKDII